MNAPRPAPPRPSSKKRTQVKKSKKKLRIIVKTMIMKENRKSNIQSG